MTHCWLRLKEHAWVERRTADGWPWWKCSVCDSERIGRLGSYPVGCPLKCGDRFALAGSAYYAHMNFHISAGEWPPRKP
jgi:hypothetical protein